ncbi:hypothetical protein [Streptomyces sp. NPDC055186]
MTIEEDVAKLTAHGQTTLSNGPFLAVGGWHHVGAVICAAVLQQARRYR